MKEPELKLSSPGPPVLCLKSGMPLLPGLQLLQQVLCLSITPVARVVDPATGAYLTSDTIQVGQEMKVSTQVPSSTQPVSVQAFINGKGASVHPWDVSATGYNYIIDFGPAPNM